MRSSTPHAAGLATWRRRPSARAGRAGMRVASRDEDATHACQAPKHLRTNLHNTNKHTQNTSRRSGTQ